MVTTLVVVSGILASVATGGVITWAHLTGAKCPRKFELSPKTYYVYIAPDCPISVEHIERAFALWAEHLKLGARFVLVTALAMADIIICGAYYDSLGGISVTKPVGFSTPVNVDVGNSISYTGTSTTKYATKTVLDKAVIAIDNRKLQLIDSVAVLDAPFKIIVHELGHAFGFTHAFKSIGPFTMYPNGHPMHPNVEGMGFSDWSGIVA